MTLRSAPIVQVALDVPLDQHFDFVAPDATEQDVGRLAVVPFGKRKTTGVILSVSAHSAVDPAQLKPVERILRDVPAAATVDLALMRFLSAYYQHPLGQVLMNCLPPALRNERAAEAVAALIVRHVVLTSAGAAVDPETWPTRSVAQRRVLEALQTRPETRAALVAAIPGAAAALKALTQKGLVRLDVVAPDRNASPIRVAAGEPALNPAQQAAMERITASLGRFQTFLLFGITGSGKSEVYLRAVAACLARGRQALILVPEVHLTPQLAARFRTRFPDVPMAVLHSHAASRERLKDWLAAQAGHARIVLGTRLAVTTPMPHLGLIIVDEEHDASFKQQDGLRYSARDAAVYRGSLLHCPVVLGSATPSLESWRNAQADGDNASRYELITLPERAVPGAKLPAIRLVDTTREPLQDGLAGSLIAALKQRLARGEQSLVFINRRGFAPALVCGQCAWMPECGHCSARMVFHRGRSPDRPGRLHCHHCGETRPVPTHCGECGSVDLAPLGRGTQRVEETLAALFPEARIARLDRDAARAKGVATRIFAEATAGEVDILVGTQMLSKGHDFPNLTLVGVLNADDAMFSADFRAPERLFAQLVQVAGRAGRAGLPGEVLIQTQFPTHPLYAAARTQDYPGFARLQDDERRMAGLPPHAALALLRLESRKPGEAMKHAKAAAARAQSLAQAEAGDSAARDVTIHDALPAALAKKGGWERAQVLVQSRSRAALQRLLTSWRVALTAELPRHVRWAIDVDPIEV